MLLFFSTVSDLICSTFSGNQVSGVEVETEENQSNSPLSATLSSSRYPLHFTGTNQLLDNVGGGLSVIGTTVRVDGRLIVHNNTASRGGGIQLRELSSVRHAYIHAYEYNASCNVCH